MTTDASTRKRGPLESARAGFGRFIGAIKKLTNNGDAAYLEVWERVRDAVDAGAKPAAIRTIIVDAKITAGDKAHMLDQLDQVLEASAFESPHEPEADVLTAD